jgi:uncharacterized membrane protein YphA (DoxX/SURF4 family)
VGLNLSAIMRRLSFTFAHGGPGVGLLLIRLVVGIALIAHAVIALSAGSLSATATLDVLSAVPGILLLVGLWTPIAAALVALYALGHALQLPSDRWYYIMVGILGAALALLGPGVWSVDARLFGWKRLEIRDRKQSNQPPL